MPYYHYTSRQAAQDIISSEYIIPSLKSNLIYLSPDPPYTDGHQAANDLAIINKPVEIRFEIPDSHVTTPTTPVKVPRLPGPGPSGILRQGGGFEITTSTVVICHF